MRLPFAALALLRHICNWRLGRNTPPTRTAAALLHGHTHLARLQLLLGLRRRRLHRCGGGLLRRRPQWRQLHAYPRPRWSQQLLLLQPAEHLLGLLPGAIDGQEGVQRGL